MGDGAVPACCLHFPAAKPDPILAQQPRGHRRAGGSEQRGRRGAGNAGSGKVRGKGGGRQTRALQNTAVSRIEVPNSPYNCHELSAK